jgi:glycosyltransferase involved in cell wall biosynthesis
MSRLGVMQLLDTLEPGGAERVALNIANLLPRDRFRPYLGTTRREGDLASLVLPDVGRLRLGRTSRFDLSALRRLSTFLRTQNIQILHAHGTSLLMAATASLFPPYPAVVWHDHYGAVERPAWVYRLLTKRVRAILTVTESLADWAKERLAFLPDRVIYLPNFVREVIDPGTIDDLPGSAGSRIVCVANLRPVKDHPNLLRAMAQVVRQVSEAHLLLIGGTGDPSYLEMVRGEIENHQLKPHISLLGQRLDVPAVLKTCDIGVLSSRSEGLPLALIEYGLYGLPSVATYVGQCPDVLQHGEVGLLVPPSSPGALANALLQLLRSRQLREDLGKRFRTHVQQHYGAEAGIERISGIYDRVMALKRQR